MYLQSRFDTLLSKVYDDDDDDGDDDVAVVVVVRYTLLLFLVERPALAVRLDLCFRSVFFYPGISSEPLNLSQQKFAR